MTDWKQWASMDFPARLEALMDERGETPSDLARRIWGSRINPKTGYSEARNRDRITSWAKGRARPEKENQRLLAEAFGITVEDLFAEPEPPQYPDGWSVSTIPGTPNAIVVRNTGMTAEALMLLLLQAMDCPQQGRIK